MKTEIHHVVAPDGTKIGFRATGDGRPLVMVHGSPADHSSFDKLVPHLAGSVRACVMDRRGRGVSDDGPSYSHEREFEDVAAVVDSFGGEADLFGHSYGAVVALEAARLASNLRRLVVYEPWFGSYPAGLVDRIEQLAAAGEDDAIVVEVLRGAGLSDADIDALRVQPNWPNRVALARVTVREVRAEDSYVFDADRFAGLAVPTLMLVGGDSPASMKQHTTMAAEALPDARVEELAGQEHIATMTAPDVVAAEILSFLAG